MTGPERTVLDRGPSAHSSRLGRGSSPFFTFFPSFFLFFCVFFSTLVSADCECGYASTIGNETQQYVFTDLIESNFAEIADVTQDTDWVRQAFNLTAERARGNYGEMFSIDNIATGASGAGASGKGMDLTVRSQLVDGMVSVAEIDTKRLDVYWGTFRASMKMTNVSGTCAAFFWYFNDTQEIDMEFLSKDFNTSNNSYPVNLVLQSREAAEAGYNAALTGNFIKAYLPFNPTLDFHEYRIDFVPGRVYFFADGQLLAEMAGTAVPTAPGHLIVQHWSNGNALWSGGPPARDAVLTVNYVKAYFNSSTPTRLSDYANRCKNAAATGAVCAIPGVNASNTSDPGWFFSGNNNMTNNQTVYNGKSGGARIDVVRWPLLVSMLLVGGWTLGLWW